MIPPLHLVFGPRNFFLDPSLCLDGRKRLVKLPLHL